MHQTRAGVSGDVYKTLECVTITDSKLSNRVLEWMTPKCTSVNGVTIQLGQLDFCLNRCKWELPDQHIANGILPPELFFHIPIISTVCSHNISAVCMISSHIMSAVMISSLHDMDCRSESCLLSCLSVVLFLIFFLSTTVKSAPPSCTARADCGCSCPLPTTLANEGLRREGAEEGWMVE